MKEFLEKLKTDRKTRNTMICSAVGAVIVIATVIAIPVGVHSNNIRKALAEEQATQMAISDKSDVETDTEVASAVATEPETAETTAEVTAPTTAEPTQAANSGADTNKGVPSNAGRGGSSGNNSGAGNSNSGASAKKPNEGSSGSQGQNTPPVQQETPVAPTQTDEHLWTQAEVDSLVAEIKAYAQSKGFTINSSLTTQGTSWSNPVHTGVNKEKTKADLKYDIDFVYNMGIKRFGYIPEGSALNIIAKPIAENEWEIYVVY